MPKDEVITRLNFLNDSISQKLADRPTLEYFQKAMAAQDDKIDALSQEYESQVSAVERIQNDMNQELKNYNEWLAKIQASLEKKIEKPILQPIWKYFDRFALYDDLKKLHKMVIPEIAKYEQ